MFRKLLPVTTDFVSFFEEHQALTLKAAQVLITLAQDGSSITKAAAEIKEFEHAADEVTHRCLSALQRTFITNFDRGHIQSLVHSLDDVLDGINDAASRLDLYALTALRPDAVPLITKVYEGVVLMGEALGNLRNMKNEAAINDTCIRIHRTENEADELLRTALKNLFVPDAPPLLVIQWKEIFEYLEGATDYCEDVADIVLNIVVEAS